MKKKIIKIILIITMIFSCLTFYQTKADSGWDTDYSSTNSSSDDLYTYDTSGDLGNMDNIIIIIMVIGFIIFVLISSKKKKSNLKDIDEEEFKKYIKDKTIDELKEELFSKFVEIQDAWMNFDYETIRGLCTDELYNSYISELDVLKMKKQKNITNSYRNDETIILSIKKENNIISIDVSMTITFFDYIIDSNKKVVRGKPNIMVTNEYFMTFIKEDESTKKSKQENICPSCGAKIGKSSSLECEYCGSIIVKAPKEFVLSKKSKHM